jgi:hypothetical protein
MGRVFLLLVEKDTEDVCGDSGTDQCDPNLEDDINHELEQTFGKEGDVSKLDRFG